MNFDKLFADISKLKVAVVGDVMLDTYWWGHVERISPEAPVPVVAVDKKEQRIGGAANVALNVRSMGATVFAISILGNDSDGEQLTQLLNDKKINSSYLIKSEDRSTTNKIRIISRNQQMMRLDAEMTKDINHAEAELLIQAFEKFIAAEKPDAVILEDYNKGVLTERVIEKLIAICKANNIVTAVDPKRKNFFAYKGVDIFKPNLKEAKEAFNIISDHVDAIMLEAIHLQLYEKIQHRASYITLSEKGVFYQEGDQSAIIPSHIRNVADVSGAGDTVIAVAALVYAATKDISLMAAIANIAGGLVCEEVGTAAIDQASLLEECKKLLG